MIGDSTYTLEVASNVESLFIGAILPLFRQKSYTGRCIDGHIKSSASRIFSNCRFFHLEVQIEILTNCVVWAFLFASRCAHGEVEGAQFGLTRIFQRLTGRCIDFCSKYLVEASRQTFLGQFLGSQFASQEMPDGKPPQETHIPLHRCPPSTVLKTG